MFYYITINDLFLIKNELKMIFYVIKRADCYLLTITIILTIFPSLISFFPFPLEPFHSFFYGIGAKAKRK